MSLSRARTQTTRSGVEHTNHQFASITQMALLFSWNQKIWLCRCQWVITILFMFCFFSIAIHQPLAPLMYFLMPKNNIDGRVIDITTLLSTNVHVLFLRFSQQLMLDILVLTLQDCTTDLHLDAKTVSCNKTLMEASVKLSLTKNKADSVVTVLLLLLLPSCEISVC